MEKPTAPIGFFFLGLFKSVFKRAENQRWLGCFKLVFRRAENQNVAGWLANDFHSCAWCSEREKVRIRTCDRVLPAAE